MNTLPTNEAGDLLDTDCRPLSHAAPRSQAPVLLVLHQHTSCAGAIGYWLRRNGYRLDIRRPPVGEPLPETLAAHAGVIVFGGPQSANDDTEEIRRELHWLQTPLKEGTPFFGICLGAQLMARALGGSVALHPEEIVETGYRDIHPTEAGRQLLGDWPHKFFQYHKEGFDAPSGAELLAVGDQFRNQAYRYGEQVYGVQFHPEITELLIRRWSVRGAHMLEKKGAHKAQRLLGDHFKYGKRQRAWLHQFMNRWTQQMTAR